MANDHGIEIRGPSDVVIKLLEDTPELDGYERSADRYHFKLPIDAFGTAGFSAVKGLSFVVIVDRAESGAAQRVYDLLVRSLPYDVTLFDRDDSELVIAHRAATQPV